MQSSRSSEDTMKPERGTHGDDEDSLLDEHEAGGLEKLQLRPRRKRKWPRFSTILSAFTLISTLLAIGLLTLLLSRQNHLHHHGKVSLNDTLTFTQWKDCGTNSTQARAKGCVFDVLLTTWIHADCFDAELHERYLESHTFPFYRLGSMEEPITLDEVRQGDYIEIYTNLYYHFVHCGYAWEMILRAYRRGKAIEGELWAMSHTKHCVYHLVERPELELDRTVLNVGFETCGQPYY
ncbi:uncharacterized protein KY384_008856 [Bacidia gigantensis]|uniref:uncharacterized protein n=1 Tax=Bacidia gigantensis TaxID=2732470 RepID=UPI001D04C97A|nr:uncharacterized protein KY384_008856 [Bacidia gigantensis]KAG8525212.1 hypothetical protein KY384_008856 [Bacidia gigantensis]